MDFSFQIEKTCPETQARTGLLSTPHGLVPTPAFIPVGTQGSVKTLTPQEVRDLGTTIVLANTYHLYLRPGPDLVEELGGLHRFMAWDGPVLTDSGGFQVFSLAHLRKVDDEGVLFRSHIDGSEHFLTPEKAVEAQEKLGADIIMAFDECPPYPSEPGYIEQAMSRTHTWAERCLKAHQGYPQALFGIVQGGTVAELRQASARFMAALGFPGYGIGGLSLGEPKEVTWAMVEAAVAFLPNDKPHYLMGVGAPEDLLEGVARGIDMFDCSLPTRAARNGGLFTRLGRINIQNAHFRTQGGPIEEECDCYTCRTFSAAYLRHLFSAQELLAYRLATIHNLRFIIHLMEEVRRAISDGSFPTLKDEFLARYRTSDPEVRAVQKEKRLQARLRQG